MFKWMSEGMKEKLRRLYFFFFVLVYSLSVIFMKLDEWYSFKPLVISLAYTAIILIVLVHFLNNKKVHSQFLDLFLRFNWLNLILNWTISHLIMVTIVSLYFISQASTSSIFLIATVLVLIIVHISIKYLQDKVPVDSPYVVLWLGLISTFIGFTLSGYAQEAFKEKDDKENLIATIDLALAQEDNRNDKIEDKLTEIILKVKEKDEIFLDDIKVSLPKNNALEQIINKGDLYNRLSPDGRSTFSFSFNFNPSEISLNDAEIQKELKEEFERVKSKQRSKEFEKFTKNYFDALNLALLEEYLVITVLELEKKYLTDSLTQTEYEQALDEKREEYMDYMENLKDITYDRYLESVTRTEDGYFTSNPIFMRYHPHVPSIHERIFGSKYERQFK
ncbi:hypothetical protein [Peribacillus frigoritolerans]|uniref:hypothetical protein n=1 Tax=Peribacillus frigoritolerans TaxID=450367 RepID=UPI0039A2D019